MKYNVFEIGEFFNMFCNNEFINHYESKFESHHIDQLMLILEENRHRDGVSKLMDRIQNINHAKLVAENQERELVELFDHLDDTEAEKLKLFLITVFETGMYMRRWKGPGYTYPTSSKYTTDDAGIYRINIAKSLEKLREIYTSMFEGTSILISVMKSRNLNIVTNYSLAKAIIDIRSGQACVRVASLYLIATAHHYLILLFNHIEYHQDLMLLETIM